MVIFKYCTPHLKSIQFSGDNMVKVGVCCIECNNEFSLDTDDLSVIVEVTRAGNSPNMPQIYIKECPECGALNRVEIPVKGKTND
jgi:hypothetical protein